MNFRDTPIVFVQICSLAFLTAALVWLYWPILYRVGVDLMNNEDYSFGLLLPIVSGYIVMLKWPQIKRNAWKPSWLGLLIMGFGIFVYLFGELVAIYYLQPISFLLVFTGLLFLLGGWRIVRLVLFPLLLLFLMIPLPSLVVQQISFNLQLISSRLAAGILSGLGYPLLLKGNVIDLGVRQLQIVDACSGLRYILSLFALGLIYCYFYQRRTWKVIVLLLTLIPAAIIANGLRVALMGIFPALQEGFLHTFSGWCIFIFCFGLLASLNGILDKFWPPAPLVPGSQGPPPPLQEDQVTRINKTYPLYVLTGLALILAMGPLFHSLAQAPPVPLLQSFDKFPLQIGPWEGRRSYLEPAMAKRVGTDDYFDGTYADSHKAPVSVWIGYFESQNKKIEGRIHSPLICLPGAGWKILESKIVDMAPGQPVRYLVLEQSGARMLVYYWYLQRGRWQASEYTKYFYMGYDGLIKRRNDGAIVRLTTPAEPNIDLARQRLDSFARLFVPELSKFIPE
jgi:exosortase D (VPLPA-CTERM-specific)